MSGAVADVTPLAHKQAGAWSVDLPSAEHFWRIADILNAVCSAGFTVARIAEHRGAEEGEMRKLPGAFSVLAVK